MSWDSLCPRPASSAVETHLPATISSSDLGRPRPEVGVLDLARSPSVERSAGTSRDPLGTSVCFAAWPERPASGSHAETAAPLSGGQSLPDGKHGAGSNGQRGGDESYDFHRSPLQTD